MRVVIRDLDGIEGYVSVSPSGEFQTEAANPTNSIEFAKDVQYLYRFYQGTRKVRISTLEFLMLLPTWLCGQASAYFENPPKRQLLPGFQTIKQMSAARRKRLAAN